VVKNKTNKTMHRSRTSSCYSAQHQQHRWPKHREQAMHEIDTQKDKVVIVTDSPLSGMGNWHRLGTEHSTTIPRAVWLDSLGLNNGEWTQTQTWGIDAAPVYDHHGQPIQGWQKISQSDDLGDVFQITKTSYNVLQNDELVELAETFMDAAAADWGIDIPVLSSGTLRSRRLAFTSLGIPDTPALDGLPERGHALNLGTSHDGTLALSGALATSIVVCGNTFRTNLLRKPKTFKVRHTAGSELRLLEARQILRDMVSATSEVDEQIRRLLETPIEAIELALRVIPAVFGEAPVEEGKALTFHENKVSGFYDEYYSDHVPSDVRSTAWGALMAVQGWEQHSRTQRGSRHRAAVAIEKTITDRAAHGYPASAAFMDYIAAQHPQTLVTA
jgi:phage/plasmid-like protein (TIGR03299 family)